MLPAQARILTCPHCGGKKEVLQLASGNNRNAVWWSDGKFVVPMMPRVSFIQRCPHCGGYYLMSRQTGKEESKDYSFDTGELKYEEAIEAMEYFNNAAEQLGLSDSEYYGTYLTLHWALNDKFRGEEASEVPAEHQELIRDVVTRLLENPNCKDIQRAELYREIGDFEACLKLAQTIEPENHWVENIIKLIIERAQAQDPRLFTVRNN